MVNGISPKEANVEQFGFRKPAKPQKCPNKIHSIVNNYLI